jgi:hypothetical protein
VATLNDPNQKFKGLFRGSLFLQTLAAHYTAISGAIKVESMDASAPERMPFAAFGISAAAVLFPCLY